MRKQIKYIALILSSVLTLCLLTGCGNNAAKDSLTLQKKSTPLPVKMALELVVHL